MHALNTRTRRYTATHTHKTRGGQGGMDTAGTHTQRSCTRDIQTNISRAFFAHFFQRIFHFYAEKMWKMGENECEAGLFFKFFPDKAAEYEYDGDTDGASSSTCYFFLTSGIPLIFLKYYRQRLKLFSLRAGHEREGGTDYSQWE